MAFKQVKRRSSLFRPWAPVANKIEKEAQDAQEDHLKKLKGFVSEGIVSPKSSTIPRFENSVELYRKHSSDPEEVVTITSKDKAYIPANLDTSVVSQLTSDFNQTFLAPNAKLKSSVSDKHGSKPSSSCLSPRNDQHGKQKSFAIQDATNDQPSAFVRTTSKKIKSLDNQDLPEQSSSSDVPMEIKNSLLFNPGIMSSSQLHYDHLRTFPFDGSHIFQDNTKHSFIPTSDITTHSSLLPIPSGESVMNSLAEFGSQLSFSSSWDPLNAAGLSTLSNSNQHPLLEAGIMARWRTKKQRPKRFQCPHCQVSFSNNGQLKGHVRIHTGERPFACDHPGCGKTFTRNEELTRHKRIHTGVRPFPCPLCGKRFGRKDHLKKHVKTHQRAQVVQLPVSAFQGLPYFVGECLPWF